MKREPRLRVHKVVEDPAYSPADAAPYLGVAVKTLAQWRWSGRKGPRYHKVGGKIIYYLSDLVAFKRATSRLSTSDQPNEEDRAPSEAAATSAPSH